MMGQSSSGPRRKMAGSSSSGGGGASSLIGLFSGGSSTNTVKVLLSTNRIKLDCTGSLISTEDNIIQYEYYQKCVAQYNGKRCFHTFACESCIRTKVAESSTLLCCPA